MSYRIEALRVHIENQMGDVLFIQAYKHLTVSINSVKMTSYFAESLGWWRTARQLAGSYIEKEDEICSFDSLADCLRRFVLRK